MFRNIIRKAFAVGVRNASAAAQKEIWDLHVGVLIERLPILTTKFNELEADVAVRRKNKIAHKLIDAHNRVLSENVEPNRI